MAENSHNEELEQLDTEFTNKSKTVSTRLQSVTEYISNFEIVENKKV